MANRETNRSNSYQHALLETSVCPFVLSDLSSAQGMMYRLAPLAHSEELLDLQEELRQRMWEIIEGGLTKRQNEVIKLYIQGFTQNEIAKKLGINQTSVHKVIKGNIDYKSGKRRYGGALKKIKKLCRADKLIQDILLNIQELSEYLED